MEVLCIPKEGVQRLGSSVLYKPSKRCGLRPVPPMPAAAQHPDGRNSMFAIAFVLQRMGTFRNTVHVGKEHTGDHQNHMNANFPGNGLIGL